MTIYILLVISILVNIVFIILRMNHHKSITESIEQLDRIRVESSQMKLKNYSTQKDYEQLILKINQLIEKHNQTKAHYQQVLKQNKEMVASISHDFRTPLTSILGYVQLVQENPASEKNDHYLSIIRERSENLNELVNEFYLLSLLDSESYDLEMENTNPSILVQKQLAVYYSDLKDNFDEVTIHLDESPVKVRTSTVDLDRIVDNLIKNAVIHGNDHFVLKNEIKENHILFTFTNGVEEPEKIDLNRIFNRLYKADHSRTKSSTGLGLAISKELAEKLGYQLEDELIGQNLQFTLKISHSDQIDPS